MSVALWDVTGARSLSIFARIEDLRCLYAMLSKYLLEIAALI